MGKREISSLMTSFDMEYLAKLLHDRKLTLEEFNEYIAPLLNNEDYYYIYELYIIDDESIKEDERNDVIEQLAGVDSLLRELYVGDDYRYGVAIKKLDERYPGLLYAEIDGIVLVINDYIVDTFDGKVRINKFA